MSYLLVSKCDTCGEIGIIDRDIGCYEPAGQKMESPTDIIFLCDKCAKKLITGRRIYQEELIPMLKEVDDE